jgi:hypothetical protein
LKLIVVIFVIVVDFAIPVVIIILYFYYCCHYCHFSSASLSPLSFLTSFLHPVVFVVFPDIAFFTFVLTVIFVAVIVADVVVYCVVRFRVLQLKHSEIEERLEGPKVLAVASGVSERGHTRNQRVLLSSLEVGVVVLGCVVFVGALATAICVVCVRRRKRR